MLTSVRAIPAFFRRPVDILQNYPLSNLQPDLIAGMTVGVVLLPQAIAFALVAGLPPEMGLYSAIVASIVGALWGSSNHLNSGPTNSASILVFSVLLPIAAPGSPEYLAAAGLMAVMIGLFRLALGLVRLGMLVTFLSDSVIVGFTAGAGVLISVSELRHLLGLDIPGSPNLVRNITNVLTHVSETHWLSLALGLGTLLFILVLGKISKRIPGTLIVMLGAAVIVGLLDLNQAGVSVLGEIPRSFPPLATIPLFDLDLIGDLSTGALAVGLIGLVEATSISRAIANQTGQRVDSNQEFVGQGLANVACGFLSGYPSSGSFNRSAMNYQANAQTALSSVFSGLFVLLSIFLVSPVMASIPRAVLAGVLILAAYGMVNWKEMARIWRGARGDTIIMVVTFLATLFLPLQFAILTGILMSLAYYLLQTSTPRVYTVLPDDDFRHFVHQPHKPACPQLGIVDILGDLYFGAVSHVEESLYKNMARYPEQRFLLLRMHNVLRCDISGIHTLENIVRAYRERGGDVFMSRVHEPIFDFMRSTGFYEYLGDERFLKGENAISYLFYRVIDPAICIYECEVRAFRECQNLPKQTLPLVIPLRTDMPTNGLADISARNLWQQLRGATAPLVIDVREPREFKRGHIPQAQLLPLSKLLVEPPELPTDRPVVMVCRGGRRSTRAAHILREKGYDNVLVLRGGMLAWEAAELLEAVE